MRSIREIARLHFEIGLSNRDVAKSVGRSRATVQDTLARFTKAGLSWPLPDDLSDGVLEDLLYRQPELPKRRPEPDWSYIHRELHKRAMTLRLLWVEYRRDHEDGLSYSQFCARHRQITKTKDVTMHQIHRAGERLFVDYTGMTQPIVDRISGEIRQAQVFVATLGASSYTFCEVTFTQTLPDFIGSHIRALAYFGGVPRVIIPDNLKTGVKDAWYYDPELNPTYADFARHYELAIVPARVRRPKDKAKVERHVLAVEQTVLAALRNHRFFSLSEANAAIRPLLEQLNHRTFQRLDDSRYSLFVYLDRPALRPLPLHQYEFAEWKKARVNIDYHIEVQKNYYSVPYVHAHKQVDVRQTKNLLEIFLVGKLIATHQILSGQGQYRTLDEHMPSSHRGYKNRKPSDLVEQARAVGPFTAELAQAILEKRPHPEQGYRAVLGVLSFRKTYPSERLEEASRFCMAHRIYSSHGLRLVLQNNTDHIPDPDQDVKGFGEHQNIRGPEYYGTVAGCSLC